MTIEQLIDKFEEAVREDTLWSQSFDKTNNNYGISHLDYKKAKTKLREGITANRLHLYTSLPKV